MNPRNGDHDEREWQGLDTRPVEDDIREALGYEQTRRGWWRRGWLSRHWRRLWRRLFKKGGEQ